MSLTIPIPLISDNVAGVGSVNESTIASYLTSVRLSTNRAVFRLDRSAGSLNIVDDTANAVSTTDNAFSPFSTNVLPLAAVLRVFDSQDGVWATNQLSATAFKADGTAHSNPIDCLRATGWCRLVFGTNAGRTTWRPSLDPNANIPARRYIRFELDDGGDKDSFIVACLTSDITEIILKVDTLGSASAAVRVSQVNVVRADVDDKWADIADEYDNPVTGIPTPTAATWIPVIGQTTLLGFKDIADAVEEYLSRGVNIADGYTVSVSGAGDTWIPVTDYVSGSNFYTSGPPVLITSPTLPSHFTSTWTPPTGWVSRTVGSLNAEGGGTITPPARFWLRYRLTSLTAPFAPRTQPAARARARVYSTATTAGGFVALRDHTFIGASLVLRGSKSGSGSRIIHLKNLSTGASRVITIAASEVQGDTVDEDFADMTVRAGERYGVKFINGGATFQDTLLVLEEAV